MDFSLCYCVTFFSLASCSVPFDSINNLVRPLNTFNFVLTRQTTESPYVDRVYRKFIGSFLWNYLVPITSYTDPVQIAPPSPMQRYPSKFVQVAFMEQPWHGVWISNPLSLSDYHLSQYNKKVGIYRDVFVIIAVKTPLSNSEWVQLPSGFCVTPSNLNVIQVSADAGYIEKITQFQPTGDALTLSLESKGKWTAEDFYSRMHRSNQKNFGGFPVVIGYMAGYPDAYSNARSMSASDIVHAAYPWQTLFKVAEPLIDHYNLTVVASNFWLTDTCAQVGFIFGGVSTADLSSYLHHQFTVVDVDQTGVLFRDQTAKEARHKLYDLTIPFQKQAWGLCAGVVVIFTFIFKTLCRTSLTEASLVIVAPLLLAPFKSKTSSGTRPCVVWSIGCIFVVSFYLSKFSSNAVAPLITITSKSISDLSSENYSIIGTALFGVRDMYVSNYEKMMETIDMFDVGSQRLIQSYKDLLDMLQSDVYNYEEQFNMTTTQKTGLFGELFNLNVFRRAVPSKYRRALVFAHEHFFPKLKNNMFQLHHADIIAHGLQYLVDTGIYWYWENVRYLADRLGWHRALEQLTWDIKEDRFTFRLQSPLVQSVIYCVLAGYALAVVMFFGEQLYRITQKIICLVGE